MAESLSFRDQLAQWNRTRRQLPYTNRLVHEAIVHRARGFPQAVALEGPGGILRYGALERCSRVLARRLRAMGIGPEQPVGVCGSRSANVLIALLGILRAGGCYVPLDPGYPPERLALMIADAGVQVALIEPGARVALPASIAEIPLCSQLFASDDPGEGLSGRPAESLAESPVLPGHLAYIIYTSGSTGTPKGTMVSHEAILNTLAWLQDAFPLSAADVVAHKTSISFTDSIWELLWPPLVGARIQIIEASVTRFPRLLLQALERHGVTVTQFVPAQMRVFVDEAGRSAQAEPLPRLQWVFNGGEALPPALARDWYRVFPNTRIANAYGMTESAIYGTSAIVEPREDGSEPTVLVGRPIANERAYVLDQSGEPCAPERVGEIHLAGTSLARGYLGRPDLTAASFVPDPFGPPGSRMYRTGDLGRWLADGQLECLGRLDRQVKIRGARVELGELEAALGAHPAVRQVVALAKRLEADSQLIACYTYRGRDPGPRELYRYLADKVPDFMIPARFLPWDELPLTPNGKVDRRRLLASSADRRD